MTSHNGIIRIYCTRRSYYPAKTLWDFFDLIVIPAVLAIGAILFNKSQKDNEQKISDDRQKEQALQNYLDKIAELLLEKNRLDKDETLWDPVLEVAQIRTITALRSLDSARKNLVLQFLRDSGMGVFLLQGASLEDIELSNINLYKINLVETKLNLQI
jgi:hypothetical protein